jgi:hypothetical protein
MGEQTLHEQMKQYDTLAEEVTQTARKRDDVARTVQTRLADVVADAVTKEGANVEAVERSKDGHQHRFEARLDRAALVAAVTEGLPDGFVVEHVNEDGSLSIEWTGERETPTKRDHGAVLKAIVAEEMVTDEDGLVESAPTRARVLERAVELGIDESDADGRLQRLETLNVVEHSSGELFPGKNFSRF